MSSPLDKYYSDRWYSIDEEGAGDLYIHQHINGILVVGLAPTHPLRQDKCATGIDFNFDGVNRLEQDVSGKRKRGRHELTKPGGEVREPFCRVTSSDGASFDIGVKGLFARLIEVNRALLKHPEWIYTHGDSKGWLGLFICNPKQLGKLEQRFVSEEEFARRRSVVNVRTILR